jgi:hypothetical protein
MASEANALSAELRGPAGISPTISKFISRPESLRIHYSAGQNDAIVARELQIQTTTFKGWRAIGFAHGTRRRVLLPEN